MFAFVCLMLETKLYGIVHHFEILGTLSVAKWLLEFIVSERKERTETLAVSVCMCQPFAHNTFK